MINNVRSLVRPVVTVGLVAAFVVAAFFSDTAVDKLEGVTGVVVGFWFRERVK